MDWKSCVSWIWMIRFQAQSGRLAEDEKVCPGGFSILRRNIERAGLGV